jgi:predicted nucleic acid-binding protein
MASFQDLAEEYAARLRGAFDEQAEINEIATEIGGLIYTSTKNGISKADKLRIVELIEEEFSISNQTGRVGILKEADNRKYLDLVKDLKDLLG